MPRGSKVERNSVSNQLYEIKYEVDKLSVKSATVKDAKKHGSNQDKEIEKKINYAHNKSALSTSLFMRALI